MKTISKLLVVAAITLCSIQSNAQFSAGAQVGYGTESDFAGLGIGVKAMYDITDTWSGAGDFLYFFGESGDGFDSYSTSINLDAHYNFLNEGDGLKVYGAAGINITSFTIEYDDDFGFFGQDSFSASETGLNIGGGVFYDLSDQLMLNGDLKYVLSDADQLILSAGVMYKF
ncbi:hypothetical protein GCM10009117_20400 [Gangjinia marincola]|uniref:Outer membrane protein beta-barrel domain-containing protein n=1 Tax=Gangjinia marincola TaxID=578463 RepID=A0ABP3XU13_9FLAO